MHDPTVTASFRTLNKDLNGNARLRPFARIVEVIPDYLAEVLPLAAKTRVVLSIQIESDPAFAMNFFHRAHKRHDDSPHVRHGTQDRYPSGKPRTLQVARHLIAHDISLFADFCSQWIAGMRVRLVDHHRQGRLERMCKIADMSSGARDDIAVGIDQRVGLAGKWRHFDRKAAIETLCRSGTNRRKAIGNTIERCKSETDLERGNQQQNEPQKRKCDKQSEIEPTNLLVDLGSIAGDRHQEAPVIAQIDHALDNTKPLIFRPLDVALPGTRRAHGPPGFFELRQR